MPRASSWLRRALLVGACAACRDDGAARSPGARQREVATPAPAAAPGGAAPAVGIESSAQRLLRAIGDAPRGYARGALTLPFVQELLRNGVAQAAQRLGTSPATCGLDVARLEHLELAVGEPLRIAAEVRGVGYAPVGCVIGLAGMMVLTRFGIVMTDLTTSRGVAIDVQAKRTAASSPSDDAQAIEAACRGDSCAVLVLGPAAQRLWVEASLVPALSTAGAPQLRVHLRGPGLGATQRAAIGHWQSAHAALGVTQSSDPDGVSLAIPALPDTLATVADTAAALYREHNGFPDWDRIAVNAP